MKQFEAWAGFKGRLWKEEVNTRDFIQNNYTPYDGDASFLADATEATDKLWGELQELNKQARAKGGVLDMDTDIVSSITSHGPGYLDKDLEKVVGLQTDKPLKRAFMPYGGIRMAEESCEMYGYTPSPELHKIFTVYHKTHNQGVFDAYTPEIRAARKNKIITGLPDTYGRGRIVGDYRRIALYGIDFLVAEKQKDLANCGDGTMTDDVIRQREELADQIRALKDMKVMAASYGFDISEPAKTAQEPSTTSASLVFSSKESCPNMDSMNDGSAGPLSFTSPTRSMRRSVPLGRFGASEATQKTTASVTSVRRKRRFTRRRRTPSSSA